MRTQTVVNSFKDAILVLVTPGIIIGGIFSGLFTPTEAAVVAAAYVMLLGIFYRTLTFKALFEEVTATGTIVGVLLLVVAVSSVNSWVLALEQIPSMLVHWLQPEFVGPVLLMLALLTVVLILGTFMDGLPIILMLVPVVGPLIHQAGIDPVHFGVLFCVMCVVGTISPPVGGALYGVAMVSRLKPERVFVAGLPFFFPLITVVLLAVAFPQIILWLPNWLMD